MITIIMYVFFCVIKLCNEPALIITNNERKQAKMTRSKDMLPEEHSRSVKPATHVHVYALMALKQVPPFRHGELSHSFSSVNKVTKPLFINLTPGFLSLRKEEPLPELSPQTPVSRYSWPRRIQVAYKHRVQEEQSVQRLCWQR